MRLCGAWEHDGPCLVAPHHTDTQTDTQVDGTQVTVRVLFVVEASREAQVRGDIRQALARGELVGPDGVLTRWHLDADDPGTLTDPERAHAERLAAQ